MSAGERNRPSKKRKKTPPRGELHPRKNDRQDLNKLKLAYACLQEVVENCDEYSDEAIRTLKRIRSTAGKAIEEHEEMLAEKTRQAREGE